MIYLSKLTLNPHNRRVWRELDNPYQLHRTLLACFGTTREASGVLHRVEGGERWPVVLVQSLVPPAWERLTEGDPVPYLLENPPPVKTFEATFATGRAFRFRLRANPTVKKSRDGRDQGRRQPLHQEAEQLDWLTRKEEPAGFRLLHALVSRDERQQDWIPGETQRHRLTLDTVQFDGLLQVSDSARFCEALRGGIGPAKAFGCGLLSLAPA